MRQCTNCSHLGHYGKTCVNPGAMRPRLYRFESAVARARRIRRRRTYEYIKTTEIWRRSEQGQTAMRRARIAKTDQAKRIVAEAKNNPCQDCKQMFDPVCMDFDHRPGQPKFGLISYIVKTGHINALIAEISKCDLVCSNCHRIRTRDRAAGDQRSKLYGAAGPRKRKSVRRKARAILERPNLLCLPFDKVGGVRKP